ncbi:hypothetical protein L211DRAFT_833794 [Terfezia boudieri ATCC MYA-4762]|uniref:Uncharacterized protein n=1 Tax=Terfezia boudieri ATCC MYA-4762 TaxID=1051890 RepID=A0A3N4M4F6_9PEZI|nr:hypothetical protein L211DRAFT_833794 [Terfezia boudieri ATCC MYA-4762]
MMNLYYGKGGAETPSETEGIDTPTSGAFSHPSPRMDQVSSRFILLKVDPNSNFAGYTYEGIHGRYVTFFWQTVSNDYQKDSTGHSLNLGAASIYHSTFRKTDPGWTLVDRPVLVAVDAKKQSPLAAVTWANGLKGAVYYLNERNIICERVTTDGGNTWNEGLLTGWTIPTRSNSDLAAVVTWESLRCMEIYVYFQDQNNRIRELRFGSEKGEWYEDSTTGYNLLKGLSGTSIVCSADSTWSAKRWVYSQSAVRDIQQFMYQSNGNKWTLESPPKGNYFTQRFDRKVRLGYCSDPRHLRIYCHDGGKVLEKVWQRGEGRKWNDQSVLPKGAGTAKIQENFIVLLWPQDVDNTASEVHLFSTEGGFLHDYLIGPATGGKFSLV